MAFHSSDYEEERKRVVAAFMGGELFKTYRNQVRNYSPSINNENTCYDQLFREQRLQVSGSDGQSGSTAREGSGSSRSGAGGVQK